ncbi:MAG: hypothetical protein IKF07_08380 [Eubacterium sp.]|nr:hypothetical protein [Eubacterium sp.]
MYNLAVSGGNNDSEKIRELFGEKYTLTDDLFQTNVLVVCGTEEAEIPDSKLLFAVCDLTENGLPDSTLEFCADRGIAVFGRTHDPADGKIADDPAENRSDYSDDGICDYSDSGDHSDVIAIVAAVRDFIENGNVNGETGFPGIDLGPFGDDMSRIVIMMKGIDDPILLAAMMFSGLDVRAISGGLSGSHGLALVALREPVTHIPHVDGITKVRVLQNI